MSDYNDFNNQSNSQDYYLRFDPQTGQRLSEPRPFNTAASNADHATSTAAIKPEKRKGNGGLKTFLLGFLGAALACALVLGGAFALGVFGKSGGSTSGSVVLGGDGAAITVKGDDATLAEVVADKCTPSVCCIYVYTKQGSNTLFGYGYGNSNSSSSTLSQSSLGSGVILSEDGYVLTNYHVVEGGDALKVSANGQEYDATVVGTDESSDLAVIKLTDAKGLTAMAVGDSDALTIGEWVMSIGSPFGLESSVATGIVSAASRSQIMSSETGGSATIYVNLIQTDAAINPGNSGGALVDSQGKLIGINTLITSYSGNYSGVGFAIPVNYAMGIAQTIIKGETPSHAQLGVTLVSVTPSLAQRYNLPVSEGAYLSSVNEKSGAAEAGLKVGDIITKVDDKKVTSSSDLMVAIRQKNPGDTITVTFNREGKTDTAQVTLGSDTDTSNIGVPWQQNSSLGA